MHFWLGKTLSSWALVTPQDHRRSGGVCVQAAWWEPFHASSLPLPHLQFSALCTWSLLFVLLICGSSSFMMEIRPFLMHELDLPSSSHLVFGVFFLHF